MGECCKGSDQSGAPAPRSALARTGRCLKVDVPPWRTKKMHFWNSIRAIWYISFGKILLKKSFKVNCWIHYHVWRSSHFSCFDAFVRTFINLWKFKSGCLRGRSLSEASKGEFFLQKLKKLRFSNSIRCIHFANILLKNHYSFSIKYWLFSCLFLQPFLFWCLC